MEKYLDERNAAYDTLAKRFLARKSILAHTLKNVVSEFANCSLSDIEHKYIEGDPSLSVHTVPLDDTLNIKGKHTESNSLNSGLFSGAIEIPNFTPKIKNLLLEEASSGFN